MSRPRRRHNANPYSTSTNLRGQPNMFPLYAAETTRGWRVARWIQFAEAERKVERGQLRRVYDAYSKECVGYQMVDAGPNDAEIPSRPSSASLTTREMQAVAGERGRSRTASLTEAQKDEPRRHPVSGRLLPAEDAVELAVAKVQAWPRVGDAKAVRVSPPDAGRSASKP